MDWPTGRFLETLARADQVELRIAVLSSVPLAKGVKFHDLSVKSFVNFCVLKDREIY